MWGGIDVGARRQGFHVAVFDGHSLLARPTRHANPDEVLEFLRGLGLSLVAVDCPRSPAPDGERSRQCEQRLTREIRCGIFWTPDLAALRRGLPGRASYYEWILHGLELYEALEEAGLGSIECFPTASYTRWVGLRGKEGKRSWSRRALEGLGLDNLPGRLAQDGRDAIAAAATARLHDAGLTESYCEIVVPLTGSAAVSPQLAR